MQTKALFVKLLEIYGILDSRRFKELPKDKHASTKLTIFVHAHLEAFLETAGLTLIPVGLVDNTGSVSGLTPEPEIELFSK
jgi:hypothetical protein